jgi:hypothetical protein
VPGTLVQSLAVLSAVASNPSTAAFSPATTVGNRIVVGIVTDAGGSANSATAITGGGVPSFTRDASLGNGGSPSSISMDFWSGVVTSSATTALTITWSIASATHLLAFPQEWNGLGAFDQVSALATGSSTALLSSATGTLAQADSTVFGLGEWRTTAATTATVGSGFSGLIQASNSSGNIMGGALESQNVSAITAVTAGMTLSPTNFWGALVAVYKATAAGARGTQPIVGGMSAAAARASSW